MMRSIFVARILFIASIGISLGVSLGLMARADTASPKATQAQPHSTASGAPGAANAAASLAIATPAVMLGANDGGAMADPEPAKQAGFPHDLYRWVLPTDNLERPP